MSAFASARAVALTSSRKPTQRGASSRQASSRRSVSVRAGVDVSGKDNNEKTSLSRRALFGSAFALVTVASPALASDADFVRDTKEIIALQRGLLRKGKGDVDGYLAKSDAYFSGYKWSHEGHTNSFAALMNTDMIIKTQNEYLIGTGGSWTPTSVPATGTPKAKVLEGYLQNADRCVVKESMGKFNAMDLETRKEWKAITCTQGLVAPAE
jgi:hypothetical protein|tara:strand:+ start:77 stop:709 length:633 start_codon:yes stop_codon:yes gene_type:complete